MADWGWGCLQWFVWCDVMWCGAHYLSLCVDPDSCRVRRSGLLDPTRRALFDFSSPLTLTGEIMEGKEGWTMEAYDCVCLSN